MDEGLFCIFLTDWDKPVDREVLLSMGRFLRSPQDMVVYVNDHVGIAFRRLARSKDQIADRFGRSQDGSVIVAFNGEIHNAAALAAGLRGRGISVEPNDADLVAVLYQTYGESFAKNINGLFSFILWDKTEGKLLAGNDRFGGSKPIYYREMNGGIFIGSQIRGILNLDGERDIDMEAMGLFLKHSFIPAPRTIFKNIRKVIPGHILVINRGGVELKRYWDFPLPEEKITDETEAVRRYSTLLDGAISRRLNGHSEIGFLLSGGLDSSSIVAIASKLLDRSVPAFTVGFEGHSMDESAYAQAVAKEYKSAHHIVKLKPAAIYDLPMLVWEFEEPFLESGAMLGHVVYREVAKHADVVLVGDGSDQVFGTEARAMAIRSLVDRFPFSEWIKRGLLAATDNPFFLNGKKLQQVKDKFDKAFDFNRWNLAGFTSEELRSLLPNPEERTYNVGTDQVGRKFRSFEEAFTYTAISQAIKIHLNNVILKKSGLTSRIHNVTIRAPFLDNEVVDYVESLSVQLRNRGSVKEYIFGGNRTKYVHRLALKDKLPALNLSKSKQGGFVPLAIFLEDPETKECIFQILRRSRFLPQFIKKDSVEETLTRYEHVSMGTGYWFYYKQLVLGKILNFLTLEVWLKQYCGSGSLEQPGSDLRDYL